MRERFAASALPAVVDELSKWRARRQQATVVHENERAATISRTAFLFDSVSIISFLIEGSHPQDVGTLLDQQGIAVRAGHHCTMPLMNRLNLPGTVRASFSLYNSEADVIRLIKGVKKVKSFV